MPDFSKQQRDFLKGPGNKENFNETNFSGYDQANIAASPSMGLNKMSPNEEETPINNLGFIKAKTLEKNPGATTMMVDGKEMPIKK
jgi:hypothetical protein